jgi:hypothetical protein
MTDNHPITPPSKLVEKWIKSARYREFMPYPEGYEQYEQRLTTIAARWGADQQLEQDAKWLDETALFSHSLTISPSGDGLRLAMRPKLPSLKEQALAAQQRMWDGTSNHDDWNLIRRALEQLND